MPESQVGNKTDLVSQRKVETAAAKEFAESLAMPFLETSAKSARWYRVVSHSLPFPSLSSHPVWISNVELAFLKMASEIKASVSSNPKLGAPAAPVKLGGGRPNPSAGCC